MHQSVQINSARVQNHILLDHAVAGRDTQIKQQQNIIENLGFGLSAVKVSNRTVICLILLIEQK